MDIFRDNIIKLYHNQGQAWLDKLPSIVQNIAVDWNLTELTPVNNLSFNYVLSGIQKSQPIILKISFKQEDLKREIDALKAFSGYGGVEVLEYKDKAALLKRAIPGCSLKNGDLKIGCDIAKRLHQAPIPQNHSFFSIESRLAYLDQNWDIPIDHLKRARIFKEEILKCSAPKVLLHGDLHRDNIISDGENWVVIDPKGVIGYPINEVWTLVEHLTKDLPIISQEFNFNLEDLAKSYYTHVVLAACWAVEDNLNPKKFLKLADQASSNIFL